MIDALLTPAEVAAILKVSPRTLRRYKTLRRLKVEGRVRYSERHVREWLAACEVVERDDTPRQAYTLTHIRRNSR